MKNLSLLLAIFTFLLLGCAGEKEEKKPPLTADKEAAAWKVFQKEFQTAVKKNDINGVVELSRFPLNGNFFTGSGGLTKQNFIKNYSKIFDEGVKERVAKTKVEEWKNGKIEGKENAERIGVPEGTTVVTLQLNFVFDEGKENQTESTQIFYFANVENAFKWVAVFVAG